MKEEILLLKQLQKDSYKAFNKLYELYFDLLYGFIFKLCRSHSLTQEMVQDTFIKVWINRDKIDPELPFKSWLFKLGRNLLVDELRKQWNNVRFEDYLNHCDNENISVDSNENSFDFDAFQLALNTFKKRLSPQQAKVFELCKENGMKPAEVAKELSISEQAVYNYLSQSLSILRKNLSPYYSFLLLLFQ